MTLFQLTRPLLGMVDAETAHRLTLAALRLGVVPPGDVVDSLALAVNLLGLSFPIRSALPPASTRMPRSSIPC